MIISKLRRGTGTRNEKEKNEAAKRPRKEIHETSHEKTNKIFDLSPRCCVVLVGSLATRKRGSRERELHDEYQHNRAMLSLRQRRKKKNQL